MSLTSVAFSLYSRFSEMMSTTLNMDPSLVARLSTLLADLTVEQEDRRKLARS